MTTLTTCSNTAEAMLLKSVLEANGITTLVPDELTAQSALHYTGSGIRLLVAEEDAETARKILAEVAEPTDEEDQSGE